MKKSWKDKSINPHSKSVIIAKSDLINSFYGYWMDIDIFKAAKDGNCLEILKYVGDMDLLDKEGSTALMVAAMNGHSRTVRTLCRMGAKLDTLGKGNNSALSSACKGGHAEVVKELLVAGASFKNRNENGQSPIHLAARGGHEAIVGLLLDCGADIDGVDTADSTPLIHAVMGSSHPVICLLLERGANPNCRDKLGDTPILEASCKSLHQSVVLLLQYGADPNNVTSEAGNSALYWSSKNGAYATAKALLDAGANPCHAAQNGTTAITGTNNEMMKRLIRTYQTADGPSWLVQQLDARGLEWPVVCDIEDKLLKEGFVSKEIFLAAPMSLFTHEYLRSLGILHFGTRLVVIAVRLEGTWLGARLAGLGVSPFWIRSCETCVFEALGCGTETAFASLPAAAALSAEALKEVGVPVQYHLVLRALHKQLVGKVRDEKEKEERKEKKNENNTAAAVTNGVTNSAGHLEHTEEEAA